PEAAMFAAWMKARFGTVSAQLPSVADRTTAHFGVSLAVDDNSQGVRSARYREFESERVVWVQHELARSVKELTEYKTLVMYPQGYLFALAWQNGGLHTAYSKLMKSPFVDMINAPYSYNVDVARKPGNPFIPHGPMDTPGLYGKLMVHEDDSRPYWS